MSKVLNVNKCKVRISSANNVEIIRIEEELKRGCDLAIIDKNMNVAYLCEAKGGRVSLSDAEKAIRQLEIGEEFCKKQKGIKYIVKFLLHCRIGRIDGYAKRELEKHSVVIIYSNDDLLEKGRNIISAMK